MKRGLRLALIGTGVFALFCAGTFGPVLAQMPRPQGDRVDAGEAVGVNGGSAYAWVLPSKTGVVLVDTGMDGEAVLAELEARGLGADAVRGVLLTHGHMDHTGGLAALGEVPVYAGPGATVYLHGDLLFTGDSLAPVGDRLTTLPASFADDIDANRRSLHKLRDLPFQRVADGHGGMTQDARAALTRSIGDSP